MNPSRLPFRVDARASGSRARAGTFRTLHDAEVATPIFMPVGTQASVKAQLPETLEECGFQVLLANTYHLLLRPGLEVFRRMGGIHRFMSWRRSVLTDSGGYQIFSLPHSRAMTEAGAVFQSYVDGRSVLLSPESSVEAQTAIGSDIMMALDQCVPSTADEATARAALDLTHRWARRSLAAREGSPQAMFGIVQGALFPELRRESVDCLAEMEFDGLAIGGLAVGEGRDQRQDLCELTAERMPADRPRYLMGVGTPLDVLEAVHRGVDMFDCIIPTSLGKRGGAFTSRGYLQLRRGVHKRSEEPLDPDCGCPTCLRHSRAYLHHLTKTQEALGWQLLGRHNLYFYRRLMREIRESILADTFASFYRQKRVALQENDVDNPVVPVPRRPAVARVLGDYEVCLAREGFASIRHVPSGEIMHARTPPLEEARSLYVEQAQLAERLALSFEGGADEPLVVWDVGLGAAANAMAAIRCYEEQAAARHPIRGLHIVSFEKDLDSLRLALRNAHDFRYLRHGGPVGLLQAGFWRSRSHPGLSWALVEGDVFAGFAAASPPPDLIFYDLFSGRTNADAWTLASFARLALACAGKGTELFTYTASTAARAAMLGAGFYVGKGRATDDKPESTIAFTPAAFHRGTARRHELLGAEWLARWKRSGARFPTDLPPSDSAAFEQVILQHEQFRGL